MNKRKILGILVLFIGIGVSIYWYWLLKAPLIVNVLPQEMNIGGNVFKYPQLQNIPDTKVERNINELMRQELEHFASGITVPETQAQSNYAVQLNQGEILSLSITESFYIKHAAHPMSFLRSFTFQVRTGQKYTFKELFITDADYALVVNQAIKQYLAEQQVIMLRPFQGISDKQEFFLTPDALVVYYQLYEYTPYVYGFLKIAIPYSQLESILVPEIVRAVKVAKP